MDYLAACEELADQLERVQADDPLVRATLNFIAQPWLDGIHVGAELFRWGLFATAVQAVADRLWHGPPELLLMPASRPIPGPELDRAIVRLTTMVADILRRAGDDSGTARARDFGVAAAQLDEAAGHLM